jgi:hypothetical protein
VKFVGVYVGWCEWKWAFVFVCVCGCECECVGLC